MSAWEASKEGRVPCPCTHTHQELRSRNVGELDAALDVDEQRGFGDSKKLRSCGRRVFEAGAGHYAGPGPCQAEGKVVILW